MLLGTTKKSTLVLNRFVFVCYFSVGKAEVPEGVRAVAARHRGESALMIQDNRPGNNAL